jgi:hypothetical protein
VRDRLVEGRNSVRRPEKWDGLAARRIAEILLNG